MFESYEIARKPKRSSWMYALVVVAATPHVALGGAMVVSEMWRAPRLSVPSIPLEVAVASLPPPPPPPAAGGRSLQVLPPQTRPKIKVSEQVQPPKPETTPSEVVAHHVDGAPTGEPVGAPGGVPGGLPGGEPTGALGGQLGESATRPEPEPPGEVQDVAPTALDALRISGEKQILPDDVTRTEIQRSGRLQFLVPVKVCLTADGAIESVRVMKASGFPAYDDKLVREIRGWRYRPFTVNGRAAPACSVVSFAYRQRS